MSRDADQFNAGSDRAVVHEQGPLPCRLERRIIFEHITRAVSLRGTLRVFELAALHHVSRVRKCGDHFILLYTRVPSAMLEVQMRVDYDVDVLWMHAVIQQALR